MSQCCTSARRALRRVAVPQQPCRGALAAVSRRPSGRVAAPQRPCRDAPAAVSRRVRALLRALCCASCSPGTLYCDTVAQPPSHFGHNTLCVLRYKRPAFQQQQSQYTSVYCNTISQQPNCPCCNTISYCNTIFSLLSLNLCNTMTVLQHKILPLCNTIGQ